MDTIVETSCQLFEIVEDEAIFDPISVINQSEHGNWMSFERFADDDDGTFPKVSDYVRLANRMDNDGVSAFLNWCAGRSNKLKIDFGYCTIVRKATYEDEATLIFKKPIKIQVAEVDDEPVIIEVGSIDGRFSYEWYWYTENYKRARQRNIANICEVYFDCRKYHKPA